MASLFTKTRQFSMMLPCCRFNSAFQRPLNSGMYMSVKNGNGLKIGPRRYCTNKTELAKKQEASPATAKQEHSVGIGKLFCTCSF